LVNPWEGLEEVLPAGYPPVACVRLPPPTRPRRSRAAGRRRFGGSRPVRRRWERWAALYAEV